MPIPDQFPYPNEHSCRLEDPGKYVKFSRVNCDQKHNGKCIDVIYGRKKDGKSEIQALRFKTKSWTETDARAVCKTRGGSFEPAKKEKNSDAETISTDITKNPFVFNMPGTVEFAETDGTEQEQNRIKLTLYDGSIVKHWFWGNLAFDLSTMKMAKKRNPILFRHDEDQRIAISDKTSFDSKFILEGSFLKTSEKAQQIRKEMLEGFPFESSLKFDPDRSIIERIGEGQSAEVNGKTLRGPGTVIRNTLIMEGSICVFGALKNTVSEAFEILEKEKSNERENTMAETQTIEMTAEMFASEYPNLHKQVVDTAKAEGERQTRELFGKFTEKFGDRPAFCVAQFKAGGTLEAAVEAENAELKKEVAELAKKPAPKKIDPAVTEFSDKAEPDKTEADKTKTPEKRYTEEFDKSKEIQMEFGSDEKGLKSYIAFRKADEAGRVKIKK
jgi:hypothetical protein